ncbi:MAG: hypothetical protein V1904_02560 [Bacteroidota bacterium]
MKTIYHIQRKKSLFLLVAFIMAGMGHVFSQNVGVGSSSFTPNYQFHIYHNSASGTLFQITNTTSGNLPADGFIINPNTGFNLEFNNQENADILFFTNNTFRMAIKNDGRVGININPSANTHKLQVDGAAAVSAILGIFDANNYGIVATSNSGVFGTSNQVTGAGVFGDGSTFTTGVYGQTNNANYMGLEGYNVNATGVGIFGTGANSAVNSYFAGSGVWGRGTVGVGGFYSAAIYGALGTASGGGYGQYSSNIFGYLGYSHSGALGVSNSTSGAGVFGSGGTATDGVYGQTNNATYSGVTGINSNVNGSGVYGANIGTAGNNQGDGVFGVSPHLRGGGTTGWNINTNGVGVFGAGNNAAFAKFPIGGCGGAFTGTKVGAFGYTYDTTSVGSYNIPYTAVYGISRVYLAAATDLYHVGVYGRLERTSTGAARRSAGVMGYYNNSVTWGALGYVASTGTLYGVYGTTAYASGVGKVLPGSGDSYSGIGIGGWGDLFGADIHGKIYGMYVEGGNYGIYSNGAIISNSISVQLQDVGKPELTPLYTNVSTDVSVQASGYATLDNGKCTVRFDKNFAEVISKTIPVVITVSPMGKSNGVYISEVTETGFTVTENDGGASNVNISFIAIGRRAGYENPSLPQEVVASDYTQKISNGLVNDAYSASVTDGLYYQDGKFLLGQIPENANKMVTTDETTESKKLTNSSELKNIGIKEIPSGIKALEIMIQTEKEKDFIK